MAALTLDALLRALKKRAPDPVYFLYGDEDVLKQEAVQALIAAALEPGARDFNLDSRFGGDLDVASFHALVNTLPLLADRRVVLVRAIEQVGKRKSKLRDAMLEYITNPNPSTVLVLVTSAGEEPDAELARGGTAVEIGPLAPERVPRWIAHYAQRLKLEIAPDAVEHLLEATGTDLGTLSRELDKLAALSADAGTAVTAEHVAALVGVRRGETVVDLVAAALER
ncbi:MAG: DNA polymerase III subunit delta, partial [Gemmatimonadales bacterium]